MSRGLDYRNGVLRPTVKWRIASPIGHSFNPTNTVLNDSIFLVLSSAAQKVAREFPAL
jgi:hypothetical protein